ncbi:MAG: hypothetical protein ACE5D4_03460 [Thermodesulfobacteriota bacterium]
MSEKDVHRGTEAGRGLAGTDYAILISIIIGTIFLYYPKLSLFFLSDDFLFLEKFGDFGGIVTGAANYHFNPVTQTLFYAMIKLFGLAPAPYHAVTLLLHLANTALLFIMSRKLFDNRWTAALSAVLFVTFFSHYEVLYWVTGVYYLLLTLFYLLTLIVFARYLEEGGRLCYILFLLLFGGAIFSMEQGVTLIAPCILYELFVHDGGWVAAGRFKEGLSSNIKCVKKYIPPLLLMVLFFVIKFSLHQAVVIQEDGSLLSTLSVFLRMMWMLLLSYVDIFVAVINFSYLADIESPLFYKILGLTMMTLNKYYIYYLLLITLLGILMYCSGARRNLYLMGAILAYMTPVALSANEQARYFYLPSIFTAMLLANILVSFVAREIGSGRGLRIRIFFVALLVIAVTSHIPLNVFTLRDAYKEWERASLITRNIIRDTGELGKEDKAENIYFVNLPDALYKKKETWPEAYIRAYIFRNGIGSAMRLFHPDSGISQVIPVRTASTGGIVTWKGHRLIHPSELAGLVDNESNLVLRYDEKLQTVKRMGKRGQ